MDTTRLSPPGALLNSHPLHSHPPQPSDLFPHDTPLAVHAYRQQQRSTTPPSSAANRHVKRKRGSSNLNAGQQRFVSPLSNLSDHPHSSPPLVFGWDPTVDLADSFTFPQSHQPYSLAAILKPYRSQEFRSKASHWSQSDHVPAEGSDRDLKGKTFDFFLHRAALPQARLAYESTLSERVEGETPSNSLPSSSGKTISPAPYSSPSDLSLSRFPIPPQACEPTPPNSREGASSTNEAKSSTVYHLRGASFDFVNPRSSLRLENIETPAEHDQDFIEYFHAAVSMDSRPKPKLIDISTPKKGDSSQMDSDKPKSTPPRSLYEDLPTAYNSITSRSIEAKANSRMDLPLPPTPVTRRQPQQDFEDLEPFDKQPPGPSESSHQRPGRAPSIRSRLSQIFRFKRSGSISKGHVDDLESMLPDISRQVEVSNNGLRRSMSDGNLSLHSDLDSLYALSSIGPDRSGSLCPSDLHLDRETFDHHHMETGVSSEKAFGQSEDNQGQEAVSFSPRISDKDHGKLGLPRDENTGLSADSTIGDILEQYHNRPTSSSLHDSNVPKTTSCVQPAGNAKSRDSLFRKSSGLSQFDFGVGDVAAQQPSSNPESPSDSLRKATSRALTQSPGAPPMCPLPPPPAFIMPRPRTPYFPLSPSSQSDNPSGLSNYSDTRHLLFTSGTLPSVEANRGAATSKNGYPRELSTTPSIEDPYVAKHERMLREATKGEAFSPSPDSLLGMRSPSEIEEQIQHDLKRLSAISGTSSISGNVVIVNSPAEDHGMTSPSHDRVSSAESVGTSNSGSSASQEVFKVRRPVQLSNFAPVAAFSRSAVQPGLNRLRSFERRTIENPATSPKPTNANYTGDFHAHEHYPAGLGIDIYDSDSAHFEDEGEQDWETIPESRTHKSIQTTSSWQDYSSNNNNNSNPFAPLNIHPADARYQHVYRMQSNPYSPDSVMVPSYTFGDGGGFPNRNALTAPTPNIYNTYIHPTPLPPSHPNPFTSSPPQIDKTTTSPPQNAKADQPRLIAAGQTQNSSVPPFQWPRANLSVVHESSGEIPFDSACHSNNDSFSPGFFAIDEADLGSEPGPEISTEAFYGSPASKPLSCKQPRSAKLNSGADAGLIGMLRKDDPRMASSPLSQSNSFAKLSPLGAKANITGTPNGTRMRDAGSSLVGNSSPVVPACSASILSPKSTPSARKIGVTFASKASPQDKHLLSPTSSYQTRRSGKASPLSLQLPSPSAQRLGRYSRPAIGGQTQLMEMSLMSSSDRLGDSTRATVLPSTRNRGGYEIPSGQKHYGSSKLTPEEEHRSRTMWAYPHLYKPISGKAPDTTKRKDYISWIIFAFCALVPPMLLVYAYGFMDPMMIGITRGEVRTFGARQKLCAKAVGISVTLIIIAVTAILLIYIKVVPNSFP